MKLVAYFRVSAQPQDESGLSFVGQCEAVSAYVKSVKGLIIATYRETEAGKSNDRPELAAAIRHAKRVRANLVVAKVDRLNRNLHFLTMLLESKVSFVACDNPGLNEFTLPALAAEAKLISDRTKAALAAAKARGTKLGSARPGHWEGREQVRQAAIKKARAKGLEVRQANAEAAYAELAPIMQKLTAQGLNQSEIAARLNTDGIPTRRGNKWNRVLVCQFLAKCK